VIDNDLSQFRFAAHALKSCSNNIGAMALAALCGKLEKITEADFNTKARQHHATVKSAFKNAEADLQQFASAVVKQPVSGSG
jgi:two-component system, sensor histidine kinase RpfC